MNKASREKDVSKIKFYGPFASALGYIIHCGNNKSNNPKKSKLVLYRGFTLSEEDLAD